MIYFLEDDDSIRKLVIYGLESQGFEAEGFSLPSKFWRAMEQQPAELVLLDIMLPEEDGLQILKKLRAAPETRHTSDEIASHVGLSVVTVRRYMNYLAEQQVIGSEMDYRTGGRPCLVYFLRK